MRGTHLGILCRLAVCCWVTAAGTASVAQTPDETAVLPAPKDGGPRRWEVIGDNVQMRAAPSVDAEVIRGLARGAVLANLGCDETGGQIWCEMRPLRGGASGFARAAGLRPARGPDGVVAFGVDDSKRRAGSRDFDATGEIACAQEQGQVLGKCDAAAARGGGGDATVVVTFPNGFKRSLFFVHGEFVRASATMSGVGTDTDWQIENGVHVIRVDDQRYNVPNALVLGE